MLLKFVIILLVTVYAVVDAKDSPTSPVHRGSSTKPEKQNKEVTFNEDGVTKKPQDCAAIYTAQEADQSSHENGVYKIQPDGGEEFRVLCDMTTDGGGWTVIQRRGDYKPQENFYRGWRDYKEGFGDLSRDFWLGNDKISTLTNQNDYKLRFDLEDFEGHKRYAEYSGFVVADESDKYRMKFDSFLRGDADDSFMMHKDAQFSTKDQNNDDKANVNCPQAYKGAWWYKGGTPGIICYRSNLNGLYLRGKHPEMNGKGMVWYGFNGQHYSLKKVVMKIRPSTFSE